MTSVMLLAAGRGGRIGPISDDIPKALLKANGKCLIEYHLDRLAHVDNVNRVVINLSHQGHKIQDTLKNADYPFEIAYSQEPPGALETGGGIIQALPLLGKEAFWVVNADVWTEFDFTGLPRQIENLAHLILVDNPPSRSKGDFALANGKIQLEPPPELYTYAGIGVYHPDFFANQTVRRLSLAPLLFDHIQQQKVTGEHYSGIWFNINTSEDMTALKTYLKSSL